MEAPEPVTVINVGVADIQAGKAPLTFRTILGSCVGIVLYDRRTHIGGLAHIMLPNHRNGDPNAAKFADSGILALVHLVEKCGTSRASLRARLTGGATMFNYKRKAQGALDIGNNNIKASRETLAGLRIPVVGEDLGADYGRRVEFDLATGRVSVKAHGRAPIEL